jgi:DNA-binding NarL/FixJ family response regulator
MFSKLINLAIVDDHTLFRKALKNYLSEQKDLNVAIQASDIPDLLLKLKDCPVQVLLMDVYMPQSDIQEAVRSIRSFYPETKILILSMCTDMGLLSELLDLGVSAYVSKADEPEELLRAIISLSEQRIYRSQLFTEIMYWSKQQNAKTHSNLSPVPLNEREKEVIRLLWEEKSNKEIADHLFLSVRSVEKIRQDLKEKIGVKTTVGLLKYAITRKIIGANISMVG